MNIQQLINIAENETFSDAFVGAVLRTQCLAELKDMAEEQLETWWRDFDRDSTDRGHGDGWVSPYMSDSEYAANMLHEQGLLEQHPDHPHLYRRKATSDE